MGLVSQACSLQHHSASALVPDQPLGRSLYVPRNWQWQGICLLCKQTILFTYGPQFSQAQALTC